MAVARRMKNHCTPSGRLKGNWYQHLREIQLPWTGNRRQNKWGLLFLRLDPYGNRLPLLCGRRFPHQDSVENQRPHWNPLLASKCKAKGKQTSVIITGVGFEVYGYVKTVFGLSDGSRFLILLLFAMQRALFSGRLFPIYHTSGTGFLCFVDVGFQNCSNSETSIQ